jgi:hypothetical protein
MPQIVESEAVRQIRHLARAFRNSRCSCHGPICWLDSSHITQVLGNSATCADSVKAKLEGIGIGVRDISVFNGSAGYCWTGETTPRMKSTSETHSPHTSASRRPANAASSRPAP